MPGILGCTLSHPAYPPLWISPPAYLAYPATDRLKLDVELILDEALLGVTEEFDFFQSHVVLEIGSSIGESSHRLAEAVFERVVVSKGDLAPVSGVDAVLTPRIAGVRNERGMWGWEQCKIEIALEWSLKDPSGQLVWADTFVGRSSRSCGNLYSYVRHWKEMTGSAVREVMTESFREMLRMNFRRSKQGSQVRGSRGRVAPGRWSVNRGATAQAIGIPGRRTALDILQPAPRECELDTGR